MLKIGQLESLFTVGGSAEDRSAEVSFSSLKFLMLASGPLLLGNHWIWERGELLFALWIIMFHVTGVEV